MMNAISTMAPTPLAEISTVPIAPMFEPDRRGTPRSVTPWDLLVWTYRDQQAHRYLKKPGDFYGYVVDVVGLAGADAPRPKIHSDAAMVHMAVVSALAPRTGDLSYDGSLVFYATKGEAPEPSDLVSRPRPIQADRRKERYEWAVIDGERFDYRLEVVDSWLEERTIMRRVGKKRRIATTETVLVEVEVCPIEYWPDAAYVLMVDQIYRDFLWQLEHVTPRLRELQLKRHVLVG